MHENFERNLGSIFVDFDRSYAWAFILPTTNAVSFPISGPEKHGNTAHLVQEREGRGGKLGENRKNAGTLISVVDDNEIS